MKFVTLNERAAAQAISFIVGDEMRMQIEKLYDILNQAEQAGYQACLTETAGMVAELEDRVDNAWEEGYKTAQAVFAGGPQPEVTEDNGFYEVPADEQSDSGDETDYCDVCEGPCQSHADNDQPNAPFAWSPGPSWQGHSNS